MFVSYHRDRLLRFYSICPTLFGFVDQNIEAKYRHNKIKSLDILLREPGRQTISDSLS